jgi:hypothetical protein
MNRSQGFTSMSTRVVFTLFYRAWKASFRKPTILEAFKAPCLSLFNPEAFLQRFKDTKPQADRIDELKG